MLLRSRLHLKEKKASSEDQLRQLKEVLERRAAQPLKSGQGAQNTFFAVQGSQNPSWTRPIRFALLAFGASLFINWLLRGDPLGRVPPERRHEVIIPFERVRVSVVEPNCDGFVAPDEPARRK